MSTWNDIAEGGKVRHMGPMAEDFYKAFQLGTGNTSIGVQDLTGAVGRAGRRIAVGLAAATAIVGTAIVASAPHRAGWVTVVFGIAAVLLTGGLLLDVARRH